MAKKQPPVLKGDVIVIGDDEYSFDVLQDLINKAALTGDETILPCTMEQAFEIMEKRPIGTLRNLSSDILKFGGKEGLVPGEYTFRYLGVDAFVGDDGEVPAVLLMDKTGKRWINANKLVVTQCKKLTKAPCFIKLVYEGDIEGKNYDYANIQVYEM